MPIRGKHDGKGKRHNKNEKIDITRFGAFNH